ncbi:uncharacterized protein [Ptychodera flava]|uniref:uncharacterized protein n=1 Tax=Ptychodera flava TaxID=63121 RepID=UPI00396A7678
MLIVSNWDKNVQVYDRLALMYSLEDASEMRMVNKNMMRLLLAFVLCGCLSQSHAQPDIAAGDLTVKAPPPATGKYVVFTETTISFDLTYTVTDTITPTAVKMYFSNDDESKKTNPEVTALGAGAPDGKAITDGGTYSDLAAKITLDGENCAAYTKLCVNIETEESESNNDNNKKCNDLGPTAGTTVCADVGAGTFTLKTPNPASSGYELDKATASTFDLAYTVIDTGATVANVKVYFSDADGSTKSTEQTAGGDNAPKDAAVGTSGSWTGLTATLTLDKANCAKYTKQCVSITANDEYQGNNEKCIEFGAGADKAGVKPSCTADSPADCSDPGPAPTNGQKSGTDYTHGSTVTYTCDSGFTLSGEGTLTCDDGKWNHAVPTCTDDSSAGMLTVNMFMTLIALMAALFQM